ncbi:WecB/TagA/CpsF family glycosyltransferase [Desulforamulus hydrothermalis]|uniref:N-acetylglucosaminyldiphosphoundecaprenol N-acetyl-beta-D-mannosaminyltransferase n=1 Tax=Desulforamulus hydrothermalis Lam5 = DSM 18033 TaxID=1121428 RepID=K8DY67_9FIRM|nr:WecB/TagA/CpsF family glycosyltransferase [Desulforamulus hydrothermalis]CCO07630.1 Glycosyl transferase, WecB/TagA/CpsF family [Desulforamulus hydrothermalis Lam5 = DSM 18033]SHH19525.1 N-acetylmannosaminyltransferase [Desulforamulus hydrothermalis Lam5 = DSM 18033]
MRINLLGANIDGLNMQDTVAKIASFINQGNRACQVITLNPEYLYRAQHEPELLQLVNRADLVTPDGAGIVWASRLLGTPVPERVTGIDLMLALMPVAARAGWRVFLLGAAPGVAAAAAANLQRQYPGLQVVGSRHGYFTPAEEAALLQQIKEARPHLLFVALGMPRQEQWIARHKDLLGVPVAIGVGGSLDVIAGRVRRVSPWLQKLQLEWLGRLLQEPSRWRRQLVLPKFAWRCLALKLASYCPKRSPRR